LSTGGGLVAGVGAGALGAGGLALGLGSFKGDAQAMTIGIIAGGGGLAAVGGALILVDALLIE
jgi:hypothetical protein